MKTLKSLALGLTLVGMAGVAQAQVCVVDDPSPTSLNVRSAPNGTIIGSLPDDLSVNILQYSKNKKWVYVSWKGEPLSAQEAKRYNKGVRNKGWVWRQYLDCDGRSSYQDEDQGYEVDYDDFNESDN